MNIVADSLPSLRLLRRRIAAIEQRQPMAAAIRVGIGHAALDRAIGGGLARGRLHEVFAINPADAGSATGFAGMLAIRLGGGILWLREDAAERRGGLLHAAGLAGIGIDPGRLILGLLPDPPAVLRAAADGVRCPEIGVALIELHRNPQVLDLTASRRLALAAEASGVTALLLRIGGEPTPSAAATRWAVRAAASVALDAGAPGHPALDIELLRQRGGPADGRWRVEWDRDQTSFRTLDAEEPAQRDVRQAALSGAVVSLPACRSADADALVPVRHSG